MLKWVCSYQDQRTKPRIKHTSKIKSRRKSKNNNKLKNYKKQKNQRKWKNKREKKAKLISQKQKNKRVMGLGTQGSYENAEMGFMKMRKWNEQGKGNDKMGFTFMKMK